MALIEINTDSVRQKASDVRNICESHVELVSKLESLVESMGDWKGEAQEAFVSKFQQMRPILNKFNESMQEFAASMRVRQAWKLLTMRRQAFSEA